MITKDFKPQIIENDNGYALVYPLSQREAFDEIVKVASVSNPVVQEYRNDHFYAQVLCVPYSKSVKLLSRVFLRNPNGTIAKDETVIQSFRSMDEAQNAAQLLKRNTDRSGRIDLYDQMIYE